LKKENGRETYQCSSHDPLANIAHAFFFLDPFRQKKTAGVFNNRDTGLCKIAADLIACLIW